MAAQTATKSSRRWYQAAPSGGRNSCTNIPWPARSPDGRINVASMLDIQAWYVKNKLANKAFPAERLVDTSYIDGAVAKLGPFVIENKDSRLPGCR